MTRREIAYWVIPPDADGEFGGDAEVHVRADEIPLGVDAAAKADVQRRNAKVL